MGAEMGKLAQAFTGRIISSLNESERGHDPTSLITNNGIDTIGACGTNDFCITAMKLVIYALNLDLWLMDHINKY